MSIISICLCLATHLPAACLYFQEFACTCCVTFSLSFFHLGGFQHSEHCMRDISIWGNATWASLGEAGTFLPCGLPGGRDRAGGRAVRSLLNGWRGMPAACPNFGDFFCWHTFSLHTHTHRQGGWRLSPACPLHLTCHPSPIFVTRLSSPYLTPCFCESCHSGLFMAA